MTMWSRIATIFGFLFCLSIALPAASQDTSNDQSNEQAAKKADAWAQLETLVETLDSTSKDLSAAKQQLQKTRDELDRKKLTEQVETLSRDADSFQLALEMLATGGADLRLFGQQHDEKFDWKNELEAIFQPIASELKRWTERPRKIERLRGLQSFYQQRLPIAEAAVKNISNFRAEATTPALKKQFAALQERWEKRRDDISNRLKLATFELEETLAPATDTQPSTLDALKEFFSGRGLDLLMAVLAFATVYSLIRLAIKAYNHYVMRRSKRRHTFLARLTNLALHIVTVLFSLFAAMAVLYVRGDWIILGFIMLIFLGLAFALKTSLPRYMTEARMLLNIGPVREDERLVYKGLPWKVVSLNVYSTLQNPALRGGTLRVPLQDLTTLCSRRYAEDEVWFPCRENDFVLLENATFGRVLAQTPESVQLAVGGAVKTYPVETFLASNPRNLSVSGFAISFKFGLDYAQQSGITTNVRETMENFLKERMQSHELNEHLKELSVDFDEAAQSSLDLLICASFHGPAAEKYFAARRLLQRWAVEACNQHAWNIPFNQLTVHLTNPLPIAATPAPHFEP